MSRLRAVFIDRDGTINQERHYIYRIEDFELIPGAIEALRLLTHQQINIYIITNQSGIARGYFTEEQYLQLTEYMLDIFKKEGVRVEKVLYCPHHPEGEVPEYRQDCLCRKPNTKLLEDVISENDYTADEIALIGDKEIDIETGARLGITTYLVLTGYGKEYREVTTATFIQPDLLSAVKHLLGEVTK
ncbi:MAG: HAD family hydrolase [Deltaproteobacteria bacterium]